MPEDKNIDNIELFNCYTSKIFAHLYKTFPKKQNYQKEFFIDGCKSALNESDKIDFVCDTVLWLHENDFINYANVLKVQDCNFQNVTLTMKGLIALNSEPTSIKHKETIGSKIVEMVNKGAFETASEFTKQAIQKMILGV